MSPPPDVRCAFGVRTSVRLMDISLSGVLVSADVPLPKGATGRLRFGLSGTSYAPVVEVRRRATAGETSKLGAMFTLMDDGSRKRLEDFLRKAMS